jgi:hypothetical protein
MAAAAGLSETSMEVIKELCVGLKDFRRITYFLTVIASPYPEGVTCKTPQLDA